MTEKPKTRKMISITVDYDDCDYIEKCSYINDEDLERLLLLFEKVRKFVPYTVVVRGIKWTHRANFPFDECVRRDLGEKDMYELYSISEYDWRVHLYKYFPYYYLGFNTVTDVKVYDVVAEENIIKHWYTNYRQN
jgi:hypothetical protein